jgi:PAS domain S-box-containing protein
MDPVVRMPLGPGENGDGGESKGSPPLRLGRIMSGSRLERHPGTGERRRPYAVRRHTDRYLRSLFLLMDAGFAVCELMCDGAGKAVDYRYLEANPAFVRLAGLTAKNPLGRSQRELFPGQEPAALASYERVVRTGQGERFFMPFENGRRTLDVQAWREDGGRFAVFLTDVSEHRRLETMVRETDERFRDLVSSTSLRRLALQAADLGTWDFHPDTREVHWDARCRQMWGLRQGEKIDYAAALAAVHPEDREATDQAMQRALAGIDGGAYHHEFRVIWPNGFVRWISSHGRVHFEGERAQRRAVHFVGVNRDVTEERRAAEALRTSEAALKETDRRRNEFLAVLSHELRNPLAPVRNSLFILERAVPGSEQAQRAKVVIDRQIGQMIRLIDDLLDVTRITRGKIRIQKSHFDIADLVRRTAEDHREVLVREGLEFAVSAGARTFVVNGDPARIAQAIGNLLNNAAKFTPSGGKVRLSLEPDPASRVVMIRVSDTGMGISADVLPRLFRPFEQADSTLDRSRGGLGLGLALVKGLVELHGGQVEAQSDGPGKGTDVTIRLPFLDEIVAPKAPGLGTVLRTSRRVLVIDDNLDAAASLREALELGQHVVEVAHTGVDGLAKARTFRPDVVICDIGLPGVDGYQVARTLRSEETLRSIYLVALTGYALPEDLSKAKEAGFDEHLAKPPSLENLERILASVRDRRRTTGVSPAVTDEQPAG